MLDDATMAGWVPGMGAPMWSWTASPSVRTIPCTWLTAASASPMGISCPSWGAASGITSPANFAFTRLLVRVQDQPLGSHVL